MRVGFFFWPHTPEYTARMARLGEELGFDLVGIADTPGNALDPWVAMTIAAAATSRIRLATCVTNLVTRHPSITASAAASVDVTAGGRTILGIGAGHSGVANVGGARSSAAELGEGIAFLKTALAGAPASWRGAATHLAWIKRPVPVYAAASGPAALRAVGAAADGAFVNYGLGAAEVRRVRSLIGEGASSAGRVADAVDVWSIACLDVAERREDALDKLGNILGFVAAYILGPDPEGKGGGCRRRWCPRCASCAGPTPPGSARWTRSSRAAWGSSTICASGSRSRARRRTAWPRCGPPRPPA
jgi:5,10-methylenetetrahydromethanopterin reductase